MRRAVALIATGAIVLTGATTVLAASHRTANSASGGVFTATSGLVNNQWFPLKPGTIAVHAGIKDGLSAVDVFKVTH